MILNLHDKYTDHADELSAITEQSRADILAAACDKYGDYWSLTIGRYFNLTTREEVLGVAYDNESILQHFWLDGLTAFGDEFANVINSLQVPDGMLKSYELAARSARIQVSPLEGALVFCQKYFYLHSFAEAENVTLADYVMALRSEYNSTIYQRKVAQLQEIEIRRKK